MNAPPEALETEEFITFYNKAPPLFISMEDFAESIQSLDGAHGFDDSCGTCRVGSGCSDQLRMFADATTMDASPPHD